MDWLLPRLAEATQTESASAYSLVRGPLGVQVGQLDRVGPIRSALAEDSWRRWLARSATTSLYYDPLKPQPSQRNRVISMQAPFSALAAGAAEGRATSHLGVSPELAERRMAGVASLIRVVPQLADLYQSRVLVCDGSRFLRFLGLFQPDPFDPLAEAVLNALTPAIGRRLLLEERIEQGPLLAAALSAALEHLPARAYVVSRPGHILHANAAGLNSLNRDWTSVYETLQRAIRAPRASKNFMVTPLALSGVPSAWLLVEAPRADRNEPDFVSLARRYGLTPRQVQVLKLVARGESNRAISVELGCAEHTVELHVGALLDKFDVLSRSELVATVWRSG